MLNAPRIFEYLRMRIPLAWPAAALTYTRRPVPRLGSEPTCRNSKAASAFVGPANRVLDVAGGLTRGTLGFVHFAFSLHLLIAHHLAGSILDRALGLVGRALDVLLVHGSNLRSTFKWNKFDCFSVPKKSSPRGSAGEHHEDRPNCALNGELPPLICTAARNASFH